MKNIEEFSGEKIRRMGQWTEKNKTEKVTGLGRRTRDEIVKRNQMTALRFQLDEKTYREMVHKRIHC